VRQRPSPELVLSERSESKELVLSKRSEPKEPVLNKRSESKEPVLSKRSESREQHCRHAQRTRDARVMFRFNRHSGATHLHAPRRPEPFDSLRSPRTGSVEGRRGPRYIKRNIVSRTA
jgi:hypothetical protein